ncbi:MAG: hypothetical protein ACLGI6_09395 [Gammaproteobacteria bacterium]
MKAAVLILPALFAGSLASSLANATQPPPRKGAMPDQEQPAKEQPKKDKGTDKQQDGKKPPMVSRRAVPLIIDRMPGPPPPAVYGSVAPPPAVYGPTLTSPSAPPGPTPTSLPPIVNTPPPPGPVIMNSCDAGGCTGTDGVRYNGGIGNVLISPQGRACSGNGIAIQC